MKNKSTSPAHLTLQRFKQNFWGVLSFWFLVLCAFIAVFAYVLAPDGTRFANQMHLSIHSKPPGFQVKILNVPPQIKKEEPFLEKIFFGKENSGNEIIIDSLHFSKNELIATLHSEGENQGLPKIIPLEFYPTGITHAELRRKFVHQRTFLLGTDKYGRDMLSRMLVGIRISLSIGFVAVFISLIIGISLGAIAGFYGGKIDAAIMWLINVTWSIPTLLLVIAITLALGKGFWQVFIAVGLTMWVEVARVVRGQVLSVKKMQYVTAARALGYKNGRIITKHILPNIMAPVIVISAANFAAAILIESGLSFLGIGAQPPIPSWGSMIQDHYSYIILGKAYLAIIPGLAIMALVMAFMLIGNALRDAMDVKT